MCATFFVWLIPSVAYVFVDVDGFILQLVFWRKNRFKLRVWTLDKVHLYVKLFVVFLFLKSVKVFYDSEWREKHVVWGVVHPPEKIKNCFILRKIGTIKQTPDVFWMPMASCLCTFFRPLGARICNTILFWLSVSSWAVKVFCRFCMKFGIPVYILEGYKSARTF